MALQSHIYSSQIYRSFRAIDRSEYRRVVRFYERNEKSIAMLDFEEYFELLVAYTQALFEIGDYRKHITLADLVIQTSILQNVTYVGSQEVYCSTLFQKAASYYNLREFDKSKHILTELLKINPEDTLTNRFFIKVLKDDLPSYIKHTRATAVFLFLMSAILICIEVLFIQPFYTIYGGLMEVSRNSVFALGVLILVGAELFHKWKAHIHVNKLVSENKLKKQNKE